MTMSNTVRPLNVLFLCTHNSARSILDKLSLQQSARDLAKC
ncbi:hypothetical protein [uncultured Xanthomonas sp.]|nr:hypothetical protein [uncultured Xanthomonas sp.]